MSESLEDRALRIAREIDPYQGKDFPSGECFIFTPSDVIDFGRRLMAEQEPIGEVQAGVGGVVWFDQNPHAFPIGTKFYAAKES